MSYYGFILFKAFVIGFIIAMPFGPMGIACMDRTIRYGLLNGMIFGLGIATADGFYAFIATTGTEYLSRFLTQFNFFIKMISGFVLVIFGSYIIIKAKKIGNLKSALSSTDRELFKNYLLGLILTLTNAITILVFAAFIGNQYVSSTFDTQFSRILFSSGVFAGSLSWWIILSFSLKMVNRVLPITLFKVLNFFSGGSIVTFGIVRIIK